jgi:hypothetical protein
MMCLSRFLTNCGVWKQGEAHKWGCDLANMHEARDKAILELSRLEEVQPIISQQGNGGSNRHQASLTWLHLATDCAPAGSSKAKPIQCVLDGCQ